LSILQSRDTGSIGYTRRKDTLENTEGENKNGQSRDTGSIGYTRRKDILPPSVFSNVSFRLVYPMLPVSLDCPFLFYLSVFSNGVKQEWTIQRHWQHRVHQAKRYVREYRRVKQEWTIQRHWQHRIHKAKRHVRFSNVCFRLVYPMLPVSLDCPFLFYPSVFSNVSFRLMYPMLPVALDCPFLFYPSVFSNVSFRLVYPMLPTPGEKTR
jgi:hypothetical protein